MRALLLLSFVGMTCLIGGCAQTSSPRSELSPGPTQGGSSPSARNEQEMARLEALNRNGITQLTAAIAAFKQTFGIDYLPSYWDPSTPAGKFYWSLLFPQAGDPPAVGALQGHHCLVFFLGGVQQGGSCYGFSSNPRNPMAVPAAGEIRRGPFFDFKAARLLRNYGGYLDVYNQKPYAYFSTTGVVNSYGATDCMALGVQPYYSSPGNYLKPDSFQIISAGADKQFGPGGLYDPAAIAKGPGNDDMANFASGQLGSGK